MKKIMNSKGFTLVELMMVIAIIAILALVLIPKAAFMKQSAKDAGVETNIRVVEATATNLLPKYNTTTSNSRGIPAFEAAMVAKLNGNVKNPFTQSEAVAGVTAVATSNTGAVTFVAHTGAADPGAAISASAGQSWTTDQTVGKGLKGVVVFDAYVTNGAIQCDVFGYDGSGFRSEIHQVN